MLPYKVLGVYKPSKWRASIIGRDLTNMTHDLGYLPHHDPAHGPLHLAGRNWYSELLHAEVRRRTFKTTQAESFHYDGDLEPKANPNCLIVTWASNSPTQIMWRTADAKHDQKIYQPKPFEVVVFDNMKCSHRRPPGCQRRRWMFRQRVVLFGPSQRCKQCNGLHHCNPGCPAGDDYT